MAPVDNSADDRRFWKRFRGEGINTIRDRLQRKVCKRMLQIEGCNWIFLEAGNWFTLNA